MRAISLILFMIIFVLSCAKKANNSVTRNDTFPYLEYNLPFSASPTSLKIQQSLELQSSSATGSPILSEWGEKTKRIIDFINSLFRSLNQSTILFPFRGSHQLSNGNILSLRLEELSNDGDFVRQALLCSNNNPFLYAKWSSSKNKVVVIRDFRYNPNITDANYNRDLIMEVQYEVNSPTGQIIIHFYGNGEPWAIPSDVTDGPYLVDHMAIVKKPNGSHNFSGVNSWNTTPITSSFVGANSGDVWMVGQLQADGSGSFIAHRKYNSSICNSAFNEIVPNWCFAASFNASGIPDYSVLSLSNLWSALETIGLTKDSTLKYIEMPQNLSCN